LKAPPIGYHSVTGAVDPSKPIPDGVSSGICLECGEKCSSRHLNYEEVVVYKSEAVLPRYIVFYDY